MEKKDLQLELDLLLARRLLSGFLDGQKCIDWTVSLMQRDYESDNLYILAGLDSNDGRGIEHYFEELIDDLGLTQNRDAKELFQIYVSDIACQVLKREIEPLKGLSIMEEIRIQSFDFDYSTYIINQFSYLAEDISLLGEYQLFYIGLTEENIEEVIIDEMKMLLLAQAKDLDDITNLIYCKKCNDFSHSKYKEKGGLLKKGGWHCVKCDSEKHLAWYNVADRKQILKMIEGYEKTI
ncbi:MAG: hypothetical protein ACK5MK_05680 [Dysgonomonas sp.]